MVCSQISNTIVWYNCSIIMHSFDRATTISSVGIFHLFKIDKHNDIPDWNGNKCAIVRIFLKERLQQILVKSTALSARIKGTKVYNCTMHNEIFIKNHAKWKWKSRKKSFKLRVMNGNSIEKVFCYVFCHT